MCCLQLADDRIAGPHRQPRRGRVVKGQDAPDLCFQGGTVPRIALDTRVDVTAGILAEPDRGLVAQVVRHERQVHRGAVHGGAAGVRPEPEGCGRLQAERGVRCDP